MTTILVIDDEESILTMMRMTLELDGYQVLTAGDGPRGLKLFKKHSPEIVLLDVRMPGMDGLQVLQRIKAIDKDAEVIIVTGHGDMDMAVECMRKEASNFLTKPVSDDLLSIALKRSLERVVLKKKVKDYTNNLETLVREANVELEKAYRFRENLIENSPDAIISIRRGGEIIIFNSAAEKLLGYKKDEVVGRMNIVNVYQPGDAKKIMKELRSSHSGGPGILKKREMVVLDKSGHEIPVYLSAAILYEGGQEAGSVGIFTDLRERKDLEKQLVTSLHFMENLIENSPDAIVSVRKGGMIVIFNSAAEMLLGYKKEEVIGKMHITDIYLPGEAMQVMRDLRSDDFGGPGIVQRREMVVLNKAGEQIPIDLFAAILYEDGKEAGSVGIFTAVQRQKRELEMQLMRSERLSYLGRLSAGIAHEINQPLTGVLTFASLLLRKFREDESTRKDLEIIVRETTRIRRIVQGVLEFARETPMEKKPVKIEQVLDETLDLVVHQQRFFGITVQKQYDTTLPELILDPNLMEQVFMNIILNAADAMKGSGTLTIGTRRDKTMVAIEFRDTGPGIPAAIIDKIFDPFFTTKDSTEGTGMGLGLSVSYGIVKNHSGDIEVRSEEGQGTTFIVRLPVSKP
jgi:PAS domain S-box-containing protein